jgi:hypothetical protein
MHRAYLQWLSFTTVLALLLPSLVLATSYQLMRVGHFDAQLGVTSGLKMLAGIAVAACAIFLLGRFRENLADSLQRQGSTQARHLDLLPEKYVAAAVVASAGLSLILELALIRWQGELLPVFAFYKNFSLLFCFAGLGLGYALARREVIPLGSTIPLLLLQLLVFLYLRHGMGGWEILSIWQMAFREQLTMGIPQGSTIWNVVAVDSLLGVTLLLTVLAMVPVGQLCGRLMARRENLRSYSYNLIGSLAGVICIAALSKAWAPPQLWFGLCMMLLLAFQTYDNKLLMLGAGLALVALMALSWPFTPGEERIHSPYQLLERGVGAGGLTRISAAGHYYQRILNLSEGLSQIEPPSLKSAREYYSLPYLVLGHAPERALIVGAGMGNDVAAALRANARGIDAVEIDPAIQLLGRMYHPERPYQDPRVVTVINDARAFLRSTTQRYDVIAFGLLDSHTLLSQASSVRLDSFVYTVEALRDAKSLLRDGGLVSLSFAVLSPELGRKLYLMMTEAFDGCPPICVEAHYDGAVAFMQNRECTLRVNPAALTKHGFVDVSQKYANPQLKADASTDDWPFFYMPRRVFPTFYVGALGLVVLLSLAVSVSFLRASSPLGHTAFLFLGAGFMLIETKGIAELGLAFGNTWHVVALVIGAILTMAFLANLTAWRCRLTQPGPWYLLLLASIAIGYWVSVQGGFGPSLPARWATLALVTCPVFFSGIVFSILLGRATDIVSAMAVNLLGAMVGGVLEYNSMYLGFRSLYVVAAVLYGIAAVLTLVKSRSLTS